MNKKSFLFIFGFCLVFILTAINFAQAFIAPSVYVNEFNLNSPNTYFAEEDALSGNFIIWNSEDYVISDIIYKLNLIKDESLSMEKIIIDEKVFNETLVLYPDGKLNVVFNYSLPANIMSGAYKFRVELATKKGIPLGWEDIPINIQSSDNFLYIKEAKILKNNLEEHPTAGIGFEKNETVGIKFVGENPSVNSITAKCQIIVYERMTNMPEVSNLKKETIVFAPGEKKILQYKMPVFEKPESYLAEVKFYNNQNEAVSNALYFRWVVKGASAEILSIKTDESSYSSGDKAEIEIDFVGSADTVTPIGEGKVEAKIYNENNEIVGVASKNLNIDENNSVVFQIPIKKNTNQPRVEAAIVKNGAILDSYKTNINPASDFSVQKKKSNLPFYFLLILILSLISFFVYKKRFRNKPLWILFFTFIIFGLFFSNINSSQAAKEVYSQACDPSYIGITWNKPIKKQAFTPGEPITFSGKVYVPACMDALLNNTIRFYITTVPPRKKPIIRNECVESEESRIIKESILTAGNTVKLGQIFHSGEAVFGPVEYEKTFTFPEGFHGKIYAMVYFDGYHWGWETNHYSIIAKEEIYVNAGPNTGPTAQIRCSTSDCAAFEGKIFTLFNRSFDKETPDNKLKSFWKVKEINNPTNFRETECKNKCNYTIQNLPIGNYSAYLRVEDEDGLSDETTKDFKIKEDMEIGFQCSLDNINWESCSSIAALINQEVFFKDISQPSEGTDINIRDWTFEDGNPNANRRNNEINPSTKFISEGTKRILLRIRDTAGRTKTALENIKVFFTEEDIIKTMPNWREVHPKW